MFNILCCIFFSSFKNFSVLEREGKLSFFDEYNLIKLKFTQLLTLESNNNGICRFSVSIVSEDWEPTAVSRPIRNNKEK